MLLVSAISIYFNRTQYPDHSVRVYQSFPISITMAILYIKQILRRAAYSWPHTTLYLSLTNQLSVFVPVSYTSYFAFWLYFSIIIFQQQNWPIPTDELDCLAMLPITGVCTCGILKLKPTIKDCYIINCIVHCKILLCTFSVQLATHYLDIQTGDQSLTLCLL